MMHARKINFEGSVSSSQSFSSNSDKFKSGLPRSVVYPYRELLSKSSKEIPKNTRKYRYMSSITKEKHFSYDISNNSKGEIPPDDENSINENIDEFSKPNPKQISTINNVGNAKDAVCCPFCHKDINSMIENLMSEIKATSIKEPLASKLPDSQLSEKIRTHYFPAKKSIISESVHCSRTLDPGSISELQISNVPSSNLPTNRTSRENSTPKEFSNLLYEVIEGSK